MELFRLAALRRLAVRERSWLVAAVGFAVLIEVSGRSMRSDFEDGLLLLAVVGFAVAVAAAHTRASLPWVRACARRLRACAVATRGLLFEIGVDLRGAPELRAATPRTLAGALHAMAGLALVLVACAALGEGEIRGDASRISYLGYLIALGVLWAALAFSIAVAAFLSAVIIFDNAAAHGRVGPQARRRKLAAVAACFAAVLAAGLLLPAWVPLVACAVAVAVSMTVVWRSGPDMPLLWRPRGRGPVRAVSWRAYLTICEMLAVLVWANLVLLADGGSVLGRTPVAVSMPVTGLLGACLDWIGGAGLLLAFTVQSRWILALRRSDPARPQVTVVHLDGHLAERAAIEQLLRARGFEARVAPQPPQPDDVRLRVLDGPMQPLGGRPRWPLPVSSKALRAPELLDLIARRDLVQRRRKLMRGLEQLFRSVARREFRRGTGVWIAPHYWFLYGASRDTQEEELDLDEGPVFGDWVGPPYRLLFSAGARQHACAVLRALHIDLIFVEDGVGYRRFRAVMRVLFEHYDVHGGRQRIEERHLAGLVGTRVLIHDYELGNPLIKHGYPEPDYEDIGRARVLHVFTDRGEQDTPQTTPDERTGRPTPAPQPAGVL
jgi:hypothetical protein